METMTNPNVCTTSSTSDNFAQSNTNGFAMSARGCAFGTTWATTGDLSIATVIRTRKVAAKGHLGLVAYVPGYHAWSPPIC